MIPEIWSQLQAGHTVAFGKLAISATRLAAFGKELAWEEVGAIRVAHGGIDVRRKGEDRSWYYTQAKSMPNYHVFLALAARLFGGNEQ